MTSTRVWDVGALVPHKGTARLLTEVCRWTARSIEAMGAVSSGHPLVVDGQVPAFLGIELGAQAAAAMETLQRLDAAAGESGAVSRPWPAAAQGSLVRIRSARLTESFPADTPVRVVATLQGAAPPLAIYNISVELDGRPIVDACLSTFSSGPDRHP